MSFDNPRIYITYVTKTLQNCLAHESEFTDLCFGKFNVNDFYIEDRQRKFNHSRIKYLFLLIDKFAHLFH